MIIVCEPHCRDLAHVPFNSGILTIIHKAFPSEQLYFFAQAEHLENIKLSMGAPLSDSIEWRALLLPPHKSKLYLHFCGYIRLIRPLLKMAQQNPKSYIVLTCSNNAILLALKFLRLFSFKDIWVQVFLHSELGNLLWRSRNPFIRYTDFTQAMQIQNRRIQYVVIEAPIRKYLIEHLPCLKNSVRLIEHPISPNDTLCNNLTLNPPIKFGLFGLLTEAKGFDIYLKLAKEFSCQFKGRVQFYAIGHIIKHDKKQDLTALVNDIRDRFMPREKYLNYLQQVHYMCLPYGEHYIYTASGVLIDAIAYERPIIAMKIPLVENLLSQFGDIGHLCNNESEYFNAVSEIIKNVDNARYRRQVEALRSLKKSRMPDSIAEQYRKCCKDFIS